ncbi:hypothetical protein CHS0354_015562 [Potamilus streckersoni]|uniref:ATP-dependent RNA helicase n=1 Tax=Potamilus streckersoni TaxID=2493646 RepID=A0AAE0SVF5_9BIVA|nr:hypothetical protein CHS0354_015562 [Potamilus streckersoni]
MKLASSEGMSLFKISRYLGEEDGVDVLVPQTLDILKRLQADAKARKQERSKQAGQDSFGQLKNVINDNENDAAQTARISDNGKKKNDTRGKKEEKQGRKRALKDNMLTITESTEVLDREESKVKRKRKELEKEIDDQVDGLEKIVQSSEDTNNINTKMAKREKKKIRDLARKSLTVPESTDINKTKQDKKISKDLKTNSVSIADDLQDNNDVKIDSNASGDVGSDAYEDNDGDQADEEREKNDEVGGFTVLGEIRERKKQKVHRVLPEWLAKPNIIGSDLRNLTLLVTEMKGLDQDLVEKLQKNNITHFFPVQVQILPVMLESCQYGFHVGRAGYRPNDLCVSAPTGSGKTLAFVLPIVQALKNRVTCQVRALAILPVRDLAMQVFKVFQTYCEGTKLKVGLLIGQTTFHSEQQSLVSHRLNGYTSLMDIVVCTPGRLVDHINKTEGFNLSHLRFLVVDEADRMMEEIQQDWLSQVEAAIQKGDRSQAPRNLSLPLTAANASKLHLPLQKLLFSATLSQNPEKLQQLNLFQPKLFTSVVSSAKDKLSTNENEKVPQENKVTEDEDIKGQGEFVGKYTTPAGLTEYVVECTAAEKPLIILHFLHNLKFRNILCFTNSVEATHKLYWVVKLMGGIEVREFSSNLHTLKRNKIQQKFESGKIDILICSDVIARGMDVENVKYVISYDPPPFIKTYIHRIGRTARAGKVGTALTLLQKKEFYHFKMMTREAGKTGIHSMKIGKKSLKPMIPDFQQALKQIPDILKREKLSKKGQPKR